MKLELHRVWLVAGLVVLAGCSGVGENAKVTEVINAGLKANAPCAKLPIGAYATKEDFERSALSLSLLLKAGKIVAGPVQASSTYFGETKAQSYNFTEAGEKIIQIPSQPSRDLVTLPCVRLGIYEIANIEAIDVASDANGQPIASVRARIKFKPEDWILASRDNPTANRMWQSFSTNESAQWMYRLKKSGDAYFFTSTGTKL